MTRMPRNMRTCACSHGLCDDDPMGLTRHAANLLRAHRLLVATLVSVAGLAALYELFEERTQHPLAIFVLPILVVATLGSQRDTVVVAAVVVATASWAGLAGPLDAGGLTARLTVLFSCAIAGVVVARERHRRDHRIDKVSARILRMTRSMHVGRMGCWQWTSATEAVEWDSDLHALFGLEPGTFRGTFDDWMRRVHPDDRPHARRTLDDAIAQRGDFRFDHRCVWPDGSTHWLCWVGEVLTSAQGDVVGAAGVAVDIDDRVHFLDVEHRARQRSEFIGRTNRALVHSLDLPEVVQHITAAAVPELADWCSLIVAVDQPADAPIITVAHADPEMVAFARRLELRFPFNAEGRSGASAVIRTGVSEFVPRIDDAVLASAAIDDELREIIHRLDLRSSVTVPLTGGLGVLGAFQLVRTASRPDFTTADLKLAEELAEPIGAALNNAILFRRQQAAQRALAGLQRLTARLIDASTVTEIGDVVVGAGAQLIGADRGLLYLAATTGTLDLTSHVGYDSADLVSWATIPYGTSSPVPDAVRDREAIVLSTRRMIDEHYARGASGPTEDSAIIALPLILHTEILGCLCFAWSRSHAVTETELELLGNIVGRCAVALERSRLFEQQRSIAVTLQRSLLPARLITPPWLIADARYWPGQSGSEVGGDFYDVFQVAEQTWAVMIGDVCGMGVEAAALTAVARHTARSAARFLDDPSQVLESVHDAVQRFDGSRYCTLCFAFVHQIDGGAALRMALGGHPQPVLRHANGFVEPIGVHGSILGLVAPSSTTTTTQLHTGDCLVLYTDGVTDAPRELAVSEAELSSAISAAASHPSAIAAAIESMLGTRRPAGVTDDTAVLVIQVAS